MSSFIGQINHRTVETNGIRMHVAEQGTGPLVILCHGFPESWYSWRHQLAALAAAGFHAVAPDMRGYGQTDAPAEIEAYTLFHLVGDMVGLVSALGETSAVIAGHDWGAPVAWHAALLRPDLFRAVIGLSVPFRPRGAVRPTTAMPRTDEAIVEELFFRYLALGTLRRVLGMHGAVWVSAVMFGMAHIFVLPSIPLLTLVGVVLGYMRVWSGGMTLPISLHFLHNLAIIALAACLVVSMAAVG